MDNKHAILIVEDEPLIAMMLEDFLESLGHRVVATCESLDEAMGHAAGAAFDVAIIDVQLKGGERVWPLADRLAAAGKPYILATGGHLEPPPARGRSRRSCRAWPAPALRHAAPAAAPDGRPPRGYRACPRPPGARRAAGPARRP